MEIELLETSEELAIHNHPELWFRVVSPEPLGPDAFERVFNSLEVHKKLDINSRFRIWVNSKPSPCNFFVDTWEDDDPDRSGFEQWWIFPALPGKGLK